MNDLTEIKEKVLYIQILYLEKEDEEYDKSMDL